MESTIICPNCKTVNPATNLFCQSCGTKLAAATVVSATAAQAAVPPPPPPYTAQPIQTPPPAAYPPPPTLPPQQPAYGQPPAMPYQAPAPMFIAPAIKSLGAKVDEFGDIVPELGEKAAKVEETFISMLKEKDLAGVNVAKSTYTAGSHQRAYVGITSPAGATILADFLPVGKDLAANWSLYTKRSINWLTVGIAGGAAFLFAFIAFITGLFSYSGFTYGWTQFFTVFSTLIIAAAIVLAVLGKVMKDDYFGLIVNDLDEIAWEDTNVLQSIVHDTMIEAIEKVQAEPEPEPEPMPAPKPAVKVKPKVVPAKPVKKGK